MFIYILEGSNQLIFCLERLWKNVIATKMFSSSVPDMRFYDMFKSTILDHDIGFYCC